MAIVAAILGSDRGELAREVRPIATLSFEHKVAGRDFTCWAGAHMRITTFAAIVGAACTLAGCAYNAPVSVSPNLNVYSSYSDKIPGRFALAINSEAFSTTVRTTGLSCSAHHYPLDLTQVFEASTASTLRQLVEDVQIVERPVAASELARQGYAGQVTVNAETLNARVQVVEGFFHSTADSVVELSAGIIVDTPAGRALGTSAQGFGNSQNDAGAMCGNTANAIGVASEKAMRQLLGQLGERMSNSDRLRRASVETAAARSAPVAAVPQRSSAEPQRNRDGEIKLPRR